VGHDGGDTVGDDVRDDVRDDVLRTPADRFDGIEGFDHPVVTRQVPHPDGGTLRMAAVDDGPADAPVVLLLHGEPTWSYLYRAVIPPLLAAGLRVVAPDLVGFGRSDKPRDVATHTYRRHLGWLTSFVVDGLDLRDVTLVGQDWGGLLGLRLAVDQPDRVRRVVAANTGLPTGDHPMPDLWWAFRRLVERSEVLDVPALVQAGTQRRLSPAERAAYAAPFPDAAYQAGPRAMPGLVPVTPQDPETASNRAAWAALGRWRQPFLVAFSDGDPITGAMAPILRASVPGAAGREHPVLPGGHFLQEDAGAALGAAVAAFARAG
jgi:haloalkane dehalogenase